MKTNISLSPPSGAGSAERWTSASEVQRKMHQGGATREAGERCLSRASRGIGERACAFLASLAAVLLAACAPPTVVALEDAPYASSLGVDLAASTKLSEMYLRDITVGTGATATAGQLVTMRYTGWLTDGTQFDSNQAAGFQFRVGGGQVIRGWELGVPEMKVGGLRQLIIPPSLGYGAEGTQGIPGNAILVFNVTMMSTP